MKLNLLPAVALFALSASALAQAGGPANTQLLVEVDSKAEQPPALADIKLKVNGKDAPLTAWSQVPANGVQIAVLIDDGLRESVGRELGAMKAYATGLPAGTQIFIGYMRNGTILPEQNFTTDHAAAAAKFRLPAGSGGVSASPYFCLSEFVKNWPADPAKPAARFVMMITNGVDPYNGSTSMANQDSPYVQAAVTDAQRAGVTVYSIYFADTGVGGGNASVSGQSYLGQVGDETGGRTLYQGTGNPVSMAPLLTEFQHDVAQTFVATFTPKASGNKLVEVKADTKAHGVKLHAPKMVRPGNVEATPTAP